MIDSWVIWKIHEDTPFADGSMARLLNGIVFWGAWGYSGIRLRECVYLGPTISGLAVRKL